MKNRRFGFRGFTLIELLLALSLYTLVLFITAVSLSGGLTVWERDESNSNRNLDLDLLWARMAEEFENTVSLERVPFAGKKNEIQMTALTHTASAGKRGKQFVKVQYRLEGENLVRQEFPLLEVLKKKLSIRPITNQIWLEGVRTLLFQYAYKKPKGGVLWKDEWKQDENKVGFPFGVKITVQIQADKNQPVRAEKIFYLPDGIRKSYS